MRLNRKAAVSRRALGGALLAAVFVAGSFPADAQSRRPDTRSMTCSQAQALVDQRGGIVMSTGQHTFDRFVSNRSFCQVGETVWRERVQTKDNPKCLLQICVNRSPLRFR